MTTTLMVFHAVVSFFLIGMVLVQFGKGAEAGLFSGTSDSMFTGAQQGNILGKITIVLAILFLGNSILLAKLQSKNSEESILKNSTPISRPLNSDAVTNTKKETPKKAVPAATATPSTTK